MGTARDLGPPAAVDGVERTVATDRGIRIDRSRVGEACESVWDARCGE